MNTKMKKVAISALAGSMIMLSPAYAFAAADTGWTTSSKLYEVRTWAGKSEWGHANGKVSESSFFQPHSLVALPDGKLLVSDMGNHLLRTLTAEQVSAFAGLPLGEDSAGLPLGGLNDAKSDKAAFEHPAGLALDSKGVIYVADSGNNAIRKIAKDGTVTTLAGNGKIGNKDGAGSEATFEAPSDVAVDSNGNVYVADTLNHVIRKITADGKVTTLTAPSTRVIEYFPGAVEDAGDFLDGPIASAKFNEPSGLAIDSKGNLYVSDRGNQRIRYIDFASGQVSTVAGGGSYGNQATYVEGEFADGPAASARFKAPEGITITSDGTVVVADSLNHAVRLIRDGKVTTLAGVGAEYGQADGVTGSAQFNHPTDVAVLADGRLAIADEYGNKIRVLQKYAKPADMPANKAIAVLLNGKLVPSDVPAQMKNDSVFLPVRSVSEALKFVVSNDNKAGTATLTKGDVAYTIKNGSSTVTKTENGKETKLTLNAAAFITKDRMFLPVRFFAEQIGLDIQWDQSDSIVVIRDKTF